MNEAEARDWLSKRFAPDRIAKLEQYATLLRAEAVDQNLVSRTTLDMLWSRHFVDSAQLLALSGVPQGRWIDVGSGAGLPGLVIAALSTWDVTLVEPRRLRAGFLSRCVETLGLGAAVAQKKVQALTVERPVQVVSARAVAPLPTLLSAAQHLSDRQTRWILPKGQSARSEVESARRSWHGMFHVEQSAIDPRSGIVIATGVVAKR